ncbi:MAG: hypothetical protein CMJ83_07885 [Planctomycetes bacterium]|nr:hypothetical protein [Planctomycetota bacterium]
MTRPLVKRIRTLIATSVAALFLVAILAQPSLGQSPTLVWAGQMGGTGGFDLGLDIAVDGSGNVYTTGYFSGTADFDPGGGVFNLTSPPGNDDIFVSKLDSSGNFVWAKQMGGATVDRGTGIAVDGAGDVYTTGFFQGTADFDPGGGVFNLTSPASSQDIFVSKLDSSGNFVWAKQMGSASVGFGQGIAVDGSGSVYTTGHFWGTADFDPGVGVFSLTSLGVDDVFVLKLDTAGNFVWVGQMGSTGSDRGRGIAVNGSDVHTTGYFSGTVDFDPGGGVFNLTSLGSTDIFVSKLDSAGNFMWTSQMGGIDLDQALAIAVDGSGNTHTTGFFGGTADFDPGVGVSNLTSFGNPDIFVSKLDSVGNLVWAGQMGGTSAASLGLGIAVDGSGSVHTTGYFGGTADFDPGGGVVNLTTGGLEDIFVSKLDSAGGFVWARQMGGAAITDLGLGIAVDGSGNVHTTGYFGGTADFDPGGGVVNLSSFGGFDIFVSKWSGGGGISVSGAQTSPGAPVLVNNANLTPGNEYYNLFSLDLCPGGPGTGPIATLGGCLGPNAQFVFSQLMAPLGAVPFHVIAPAVNPSWGPFTVPPTTMDALCVDVTSGIIGPVSPVVRIVVQ